MTVQVRVLGEFEVRLGDCVVTPSQPKVRQLLALLAVSRNNVVRTEALRTELWGDKAPAKASTTLQAYMSQIRRVLVPEGTTPPRGVLVHKPRVGYALNLPDRALDVAQFTELARRGRAELDEGRWEEAGASLRAALDVWQGAALSDIDPGPVLAEHVARLREERGTVLEQRVEVDLFLGRHLELIGELGRLIQQYPSHEGLHAKLMVALHRAGRRSEALRVFQRIRATLVEQLGLEPGAELQRLHQQLLDGDTGVDEPKGSISLRRQMPWCEQPAQLVPGPEVLVGRDEQVALAERTLRESDGPRPTLVSVTGPPGVGTSAFCAHVANLVREVFPDGQVYADLDEQEPAEVLAGFLRAIYGPGFPLPASPQERADLFRSWTARRRVLVLLDNVSDPAVLGPLSPGGSGSAVIVGCRRRIVAPTASLAIRLEPLTVPDSLRLLSSTIGARVDAEPQAARELARLGGGLPMVLVAAANRLGLRPHWSVARLLDRVKARGDLPRELATGPLDLVDSVARRIDRLAGPQCTVLRRILDAGEPISVAAAALASGMDEWSVETVLEQLVEFQLVEVDTHGPREPNGFFRYRVHPLVRLAALGVLDGERGESAPRCALA